MFPLTKMGIYLDRIFCNLENLSFTVSHPRYFDHHPVIFQAQHSICNEAASFGESYSKSSFNPLLFNENLDSLYRMLTTNNLQDSFYTLWYEQISYALTHSILRKRLKRSTAPYFYSSHSIHLINRKDTLIRQLRKNWSLSGSLKLKEIINSLDESIELDKLLLVEKFNLKNLKDCFRLISTLRNTKTYPPVM